MINVPDILKANILIVDDQAANVSLLEQMLRGAGYLSIASTMDPFAVCELHRQHRYDLILLDLQMPGMDGFQVMEGLREIETGSYLPVLVITAQPDHQLRALKAGAKDFVSKPFDLAEVLMRVYNLLEVRLLHLAAGQRTKRVEAQFIEAQKMEGVGQLAAGVAHDFNNLLAIIMGYGNLIASGLGAASPLLKYAEEIQHAAERAVGLTRQLLVFSRKQTVQPVVLDLNDVVKGMDKMLQRFIDKHISMTILPGKQTGRVKADAGYVGQVLMNLVVNARDAMPNGGRLTIAVNNVTLDENYTRTHPDARPGDYVMLSVSDTGTGITEEVQAHLFEPFFTTKPLGKGTGLGLTTCQTVVQQSGGHIGVYSEVGTGTTFKVYFPRVEQPLDAAARPGQTGPLPRGTETLLLVEDEPSLRQLAHEVLTALGYEVLTAANGRDALCLADAHKGPAIRLVVTDVIMPLMGGKAMAERLKITNPDIKILFTSGFTDDAIAEQGVLAPGVEFLPKPYLPGTLARKVRGLLDSGILPPPVAEKAAPAVGSAANGAF